LKTTVEARKSPTYAVDEACSGAWILGLGELTNQQSLLSLDFVLLGVMMRTRMADHRRCRAGWRWSPLPARSRRFDRRWYLLV